jgi:hypothetical protein
MTTMAIPESQLETWSHQGAVTASKNTYASIKSNLEAAGTSYAAKSFEVFLQGSYGNDTNIRADSDVDVIVMLTSIFRSDISRLPKEQADAYRRAFSDATYRLADFKNEVVAQLRSAYGSQSVYVGNKSVKIGRSSDRLGADVVVCHQYRYYYKFYSTSNQSYDEGILFTTSSGDEIINYPKLHSKNCTAKHQSTGNRFKPLVRVLKNMRGRLIGDGQIGQDLAPSYFIEGMLYNVPETQFNGNLSTTFCNCIKWLLRTDRSKFVCPSRMHYLFGDSSVQWDNTSCGQFLDALVGLWNRW